MRPSGSEPESLAEGTLISHLLELRTRLLHTAVAVMVVFVPLRSCRTSCSRWSPSR